MTILETEMWLRGESFDPSKDKKRMEATIVFLDEGTKIMKADRNIPFDTEKKQRDHMYEIQVEHKKERKTWQMNETSERRLMLIWGRDMAKWIGKKAVLTSTEQQIGKHMRNVVFVDGDATRDIN